MPLTDLRDLLVPQCFPLSLSVCWSVGPSINFFNEGFFSSVSALCGRSQQNSSCPVEVRAVHSQSQIALHTRMKGLLQSRGSISGTEAPVVPWRMTLSVECLWGTVLCATGVVLHNSIPKAITPQKVLEELSLVSFRHPQSQALIRTKVTSNRHSRPPCKVFSLFLLCFDPIDYWIKWRGYPVESQNLIKSY